MVQHAHKTCTDWSSTRLYDPVPTLALKSYPTLSPSRPCSATPSSIASSTTLTPTPSTTPPQPKSFLTDLISASPPSLRSPSPSPPSSSSFDPPRSSGGGGATTTTAGGLYTIAALESLHAPSNHPFTHLPCPHPQRCPDPACPDPACVAAARGPPALHADAILVSVHGAYSHHHAHHRPFAAASVYFAAGSPLNKVVRLDEEYPGVGAGGGGADGGDGGGAGRVDGGSSFGEVTRQRAELLAGIRALERVADVVRALEEGARAGKWGGKGGKKTKKGAPPPPSSMGAPGSRGWYVAGIEKKTGRGGVVGMGLGDEEDDDEEEGEEEGDGDDDGALSQVVLKTHSKYLVRTAVEGLDKWKANGWMNSKGKVVANVDLLWYLDRRITWLEWVGVEVMFLLVGKEDNEGPIKLVGKTLD